MRKGSGRETAAEAVDRAFRLSSLSTGRSANGSSHAVAVLKDGDRHIAGGRRQSPIGADSICASAGISRAAEPLQFARWRCSNEHFS